jgi:hypothetical protein
MRYDGRKYIKTFVDVLPVEDVKKVVKKTPTKKTASVEKVVVKKTPAKKAAPKAATKTTSAADITKMTVKDLKEKAKASAIK